MAKDSFTINSSILTKIPLFDTLSTGEVKLLTRHMSFIRIKEGTVFCREGDSGNFVAFIAQGKVDIIKEGKKGKFAVINTLYKGRSIGEMALIDETPRSASLRAKEDVVLLKLTKKSFDMIIKNYPSMGIKILKGLARLLSMNMRKTSSRLADYMTPLS